MRNLWSNLRQSCPLVVWARRVLLSVLSAIFVLAQSTPYALATLGSGSSHSFGSYSHEVLDSDADLGVIRAQFDEKPPVRFQVAYNCTLAVNDYLVSLVSHGCALEERREYSSARYLPDASLVVRSTARYRTACRGPPAPDERKVIFPQPRGFGKSNTDPNLARFRS